MPPRQQDAGTQIFLMKSAQAGQPISFTVSGTGSFPREEQNGQGDNGQGGAAQSGPGGGIAPPINTPDPLSKYKWWILGGLGLLLAAAAAFLLRKPPGAAVAGGLPDGGALPYPAFSSPAGKQSQLLNALKEELFALESEKINGSIAPEEYAHVKAALETVLKRALNRK